MESLQEQKSPRDGSIIEVPQQQLEQIMKLWIEIFKKSLTRRDTQSMRTATVISVEWQGWLMAGEAGQAPERDSYS